MRRERKRIPNFLRKYRRLIGYSQKAVAKKLHQKSTAIISRWEKGLTMPSAQNLLKLSRLYKVLPQQLYYELDREIVRELNPGAPETMERKFKGSDP